MGPRAGLEAVAKGEILAPARKATPVVQSEVLVCTSFELFASSDGKPGCPSFHKSRMQASNSDTSDEVTHLHVIRRLSPRRGTLLYHIHSAFEYLLKTHELRILLRIETPIAYSF
jgi:hypothetical protein